MYFITKTLNPNKGYSCVFRQWHASSHCRWLHGYDLIFSVTIEADTLSSEGWVFDLGNFGLLKDRIEQHFDHKVIIAEDDPIRDELKALSERDIASITILPSVGIEAFAMWLAVETTDLLMRTGHLDRCRVRSASVSEHGGSTGGYIP